MNNNHTTYGNDPEALSEFIIDCIPQDNLDSINDSVEYVKKLLSIKLMDFLVLKMTQQDTQSVSRDLFQVIQSLSIKSLGEFLFKSVPDLSLLEKFKNYFKYLANMSPSEVEKKAAATIYFITIACACLHHDKIISTLSRPELLEQFQNLSAQSELPPEIHGIFIDTRDYLEHESEKSSED